MGGGDEPGAEARGPDEPDAEREGAYELLQRGQALLKRRHHAQAAIVLERAARLEPGRGSILEPLGRAYHLSGQFERARETFAALLELDPSGHWAHFALGQVLRKLGRPGEARTHLRLAIALHPSSELYRGALARLGPERPPERQPVEPGPQAAAEQAAPPAVPGPPEAEPDPPT